MGTPAYMAPEQACGEMVDPRADVFALGSVLAVVLTGKPAFVAPTAVETIRKAANADLTDVLTRLDGCGADADLIALAKRCLSANRDGRPTDGRAVAYEVGAYRAGVEARLRQAETDRAEAVVREGEQRKRRRLAQWLGGAVAAVLTLGIIGTAFGMVLAKNSADQEHAANIQAQTEKENAKRAKETAEREKETAEREKTNAETVLGFFRKNLIHQANPYENSRWAFADRTQDGERRKKQPDERDLTVRELVERASQEYSPEGVAKKFPDQPVIQAGILESIGETFEGLGDHAKAVRFVEAAQAVRERHLGPTHPDVLTGRTNLVFSYLAAGRAVDAVKAMEVLGDRLEAAVRELPNDPDQLRAHPALAKVDAVLNRMEERSNPQSFTYPKFELTLTDGAWLAVHMPAVIGRVSALSEAVAARFGPDDRRTLLVEIWAAFAHHAIGQTRKASEMYERILARAEKNLHGDDLVVHGLREVLVMAYGDLNIKQAEAIVLLERGYQARQKAVGPYHPSTLNNLLNLAVAYRAAGRIGDALAVLEPMREPCLNTLKPDHPYALPTLQVLADTYRASKRYPEAIALFEQVRDVRVKAQGADHPETIDTLYGLAETYTKVGRFADAIPLFEQVRDADVRAKLPADDSNRLLALNSLASAYRDGGKPAEAVNVYEQVRDVLAKTQGADHPDTLAAASRLAAAYRAGKKLPAAITLYEQIREARMKKPGPDHPDTLATLNSLAATYRVAGRYADAVRTYEQVRDAQAKKLGPDDPQTIATIVLIGRILQEAGRVSDAIKLFEDAHDRRVRALGPEHKDTLVGLSDIAGAYYLINRIPDAIKLYEQVREAQVRTLGEDHEFTLITSGNLALMYRTAKRPEEAIKLHEKVLDAQVAKYGADDTRTLSNINNMAMAYEDVGRLDEAIKLYQQVQDVRVKKSGPDHVDTLITQNNLANAYLSAGRLDDAVKLFEQVLEVQLKKFGPDHPNNLTTSSGLAIAYQAAGRLGDALPLFESSAAGVVKRDFQHVHAGKILTRTVAAYTEAGQYDKAAGWQRKWAGHVRDQAGLLHPAHASELAALGLLLLRQGDWEEAERSLRASLTIREKKEPDAWTTFNTHSMLGAALLGQKKYTDAEPLLLKGYEGMKEREKTVPKEAATRIPEALDRLIELYTATNKPDEVKKYTDLRAKYPAAKKETLPPPRAEK